MNKELRRHHAVVAIGIGFFRRRAGGGLGLRNVG